MLQATLSENRVAGELRCICSQTEVSCRTCLVAFPTSAPTGLMAQQQYQARLITRALPALPQPLCQASAHLRCLLQARTDDPDLGLTRGLPRPTGHHRLGRNTHCSSRCIGPVRPDAQESAWHVGRRQRCCQQVKRTNRSREGSRPMVKHLLQLLDPCTRTCLSSAQA